MNPAQQLAAAMGARRIEMVVIGGSAGGVDALVRPTTI